MSWIDGAWHRLRVFVRGERYAREQREELRVHLELEAQQHTLEREAAARRLFGNLTNVGENLRAAAGFGWLDRLKQDLGYALRGLRRSPGFTLTVVVTLALGVGANAAIFSFLDRVFLRAPTGIAHPDELRRLYISFRDLSTGRLAPLPRFGYPEYEETRNAIGSRAVLTADMPAQTRAVRRGEGVDSVEVAIVADNYLSLLGVRAARGRFFAPDESTLREPSNVAIITHRLWRRMFALDPAAVGTTIQVLGRSRTIIGVTAEGFDGIDIERAELFLPLNAYTAGSKERPWYQDARTWSPLRPLMRIAPKQVEQQIVAIANPAFQGAYAATHARADTGKALLVGPIVAAAGPGYAAPEVALSIRIGGVTLVLLLITCVNVATLLLLRGARRQREIALRLALGVTRGRLWTQVLTESLTLALIGAMLALGVAHWGGLALRRLLLPDTAWAGPPLDARVTAFALLAAFVVGLVAGLAPAFQAVGADVHTALKAGARNSAYRNSRLRATLLGGQVALSLLLLVGAGLFVRSLDNIRSVPIGFDPDRTIYTRASTTSDSPAMPVGTALALAAATLRETPGVRAAGVALMMPMMGGRFRAVYLPDRDTLPRISGLNAVSAEFFDATSMPFIAGRPFTRDEVEGGANLVVINASLAKYLWPGENALGKCVSVAERSAPCSYVVGVTVPTRNRTVLEASPNTMLFLPLRASNPPDANTPGALIVSTDPANAAAVSARIREVLLAMIPGGNIVVTRMTDALDWQYRSWRLGAQLFTAFGILALLVATIGVYSVVSYAVSQRTHEMGVRVALGAQARNILDLIVRDGIRVVAMGVVVGLLLAAALGRLIASQLFGVATRDPYVMMGAAAVLIAAALVACLIPAWRAARVDPMTTLRAE